MAELNNAQGNKNRHRRQRVKKLSTRVDLTPMVDLGFLLITFFIYTTTMSQPTAMKMALPNDSTDSLQVKASSVMTIIVGKDNRIFYYERADLSKLSVCGLQDIREVIINKKRRTDPAYFMIILKASAEASYGSTVAILDEMTIDAIKHYTFIDISSAENEIVKSKNIPNSLK